MAITNLTLKVSLNTRTVDLLLHKDDSEEGIIAYTSAWDINGYVMLVPRDGVNDMTPDLLGLLMDFTDQCIDSEMASVVHSMIVTGDDGFVAPQVQN